MKIEVTLSADQQEGTQSVLSQWFKKPGDAVKQHEPLCEVATDKVNVEVSAPEAGVLVEIRKQPKDNVGPGEVLAIIDTEAPASVVESSSVSHQPAGAARRQAPAGAGSAAAATQLSPAVRKLLSNHGLSAAEVRGTGKDGRITADDVLRHVEARRSAPSHAGPSRKIPHSVMRKSIADHMVSSLLHTAPHVTTVFEADMSAVIADRAKRKADFEKRGAPLTFTAYFVQATIAGLKAVPEVNSVFHSESLEVFEDFNIGIGTAVDGVDGPGLLVPVLRRAQDKDLFATAQALQDLTSRARAGSLTPADVRGGTFTISNHGVSGSLFAAPIIINQPQSAILGIGKLEQRPTIDSEGKVVAKPKLYVTLTIDHRVLDGFRANLFMSTFVSRLEGSWE